MPLISDYITQYQQAAQEARTANEARYKQGLGIMQQAADLYKPGGGFGASGLAQIEATKARDVAGMGQQQVSSGLFGTSVPANNAMAWESNVGSQARLNLQDLQTSGYAGALSNLTNFISSITQAGPDAGLFGSLIQAASAGGGTTGGGGFSTGGGGGGDTSTGGGNALSAATLADSYARQAAADERFFAQGRQAGGYAPATSQQQPTTAWKEPAIVPGKVLVTDDKGDWGYNEQGQMVLLKPKSTATLTKGEGVMTFEEWSREMAKNNMVFPAMLTRAAYDKYLASKGARGS